MAFAKKPHKMTVIYSRPGNNGLIVPELMHVRGYTKPDAREAAETKLADKGVFDRTYIATFLGHIEKV